MKILLKNAKIYTGERDCGIFEGNIIVNDENIEYVGSESFDDHYDRVIDCDGDLLMPTFKNAHTHTAMVIFRSYQDETTLQEWLFDYIIPREQLLTKDDIYYATQHGILEYLRNGIGMCFDMYYYEESIAKACRDLGFKASILCMPSAEEGKSAHDVVKFLKSVKGHSNLIKPQIGFHAIYTSSEDNLKYISKLSHELKIPVFTHNSETKQEIKDCQDRFDGLTPTEAMDKFGLFDYGGACYHSIHLTENDMNIYKKRNISVVANPGSNIKLGSGICPLKDIKKKGIRFAIGTDGASSNNSLDMFYEMKLACLLEHLNNDNKDWSITSADVLHAATSSGARVCGFKDSDSLKVGKKADIIRLNLHDANLNPQNNIIGNVVYSGNASNILMTMINGKILYENGEFNLPISESEIIKRSNDVSRRILNEKLH